MTKTYEIDVFSEASLKEFDNVLEQLETMFDTEEFKEYILEKSQAELDRICTESLHNLESYDIEGHYLGGMYTMIEDDTIILGNNSMVDIEGKNMSPEAKLRYSTGLSLAKIVEFGVGAKGTSDESWEVNVNQQEHMTKYGRDGWYYVDESGNIHWTTGIEGKFIFYKLSESIKQNIQEWVNEYIENNLD